MKCPEMPARGAPDGLPRPLRRDVVLVVLEAGYGRFPKFHRVCLGRDPGTLKSDIVSKKHPQ